MEKHGPSIGQDTEKKFKQALIAAAKALEAKEDKLNKLDGCGDGNFHFKKQCH